MSTVGSIAAGNAEIVIYKDAAARPDVRLYGTFSKVDAEQRIVGGVFTSEAIDVQDDMVDWDATKEAVDDWRKWSNIREMHQPSAVGVAVTIELDDTKKQAYLEAKIVDDAAWEKVVAGVYKGFSIGGKVLQAIKEAAGIRRIIRYILNEVSLVDKPANPEAVFLFAKRAADNMQGVGSIQTLIAKASIPGVGDVTFPLPEGATGASIHIGDTVIQAEAVAKDAADESALQDMGYITRLLQEAIGILQYLKGHEAQEIAEDATGEDDDDGDEGATAVAMSMAAGVQMAKAGRTLSADSMDQVHKAVGHLLAMCKDAGCDKCAAAHAAFTKDGGDAGDMEDAAGGGPVGAADEGAKDKNGKDAKGGDAKDKNPPDGEDEQDDESDDGEAGKSAANNDKTAAATGASQAPVFNARELARAMVPHLAPLTEGLAKGAEVTSLADKLGRAAAVIERLEARVQALEDQPAPGGPVLRPDAVNKSAAVGAPAPAEMTVEQQVAALEIAWNDASGFQKDAIGRQIAYIRARTGLK